MISLGDIPEGSIDSIAYDVSADGSIVVGFAQSATEANAFIWDADHGMRVLRDVLTNDFGLDLTGWRLREATGISADGVTIVGWGVNPDGDFEAWIAVIPQLFPGDLNCDGEINAFDIEPFLLALFDPDEYALRFPDCDINNGDINGDGEINAFDIEPFLGLLFP